MPCSGAEVYYFYPPPIYFTYGRLLNQLLPGLSCLVKRCCEGRVIWQRSPQSPSMQPRMGYWWSRYGDSEFPCEVRGMPAITIADLRLHHERCAPLKRRLQLLDLAPELGGWSLQSGFGWLRVSIHQSSICSRGRS